MKKVIILCLIIIATAACSNEPEIDRTYLYKGDTISVNGWIQDSIYYYKVVNGTINASTFNGCNREDFKKFSKLLD